MALIYTLEFPDNLFTTARDDEQSLSDPNLTTTFSGSDGTYYSTTNYRTNPTVQGLYEIPAEDIASQDLKVRTALEENKSKITYSFSLIGPTAKAIIDYINYVRFPKQGQTISSPTAPVEGIEYLFNVDKQIRIVVSDDCCKIPINNRLKPKPVLEGYIPLNSIRYCTDSGCKVDCTIYEDSRRTDAIACLESTVLGLKSNVGYVARAESINNNLYLNQSGIDTFFTFAGVSAKWFDMCIEPKSPGLLLLLMNFLGIFKTLILFPLIVILSIVILIATVINTIIRAINVIPGINISLISIGSDVTGNDPFSEALDILDELLGLETLVENVFGCKYVRGGYRVSSIIKAACSVCGFTQETLDDLFSRGGLRDDYSDVKTPVSYNPFVPFGDVTTPIITEFTDTFNTAYVPAETAYTKRQEKKIKDDNSDASTTLLKTNILKEVAIRATPIETLDKVLGRLGTLWGTGWDVVTCPISPDSPNGLQLQVGPLEGRYAFDKREIININREAETSVSDVSVCYEVGDGSAIGYQTQWLQDSSDTEGNSQSPNYKGYISYQIEELKDRKPKKIKNIEVDFAPVQHVGTIKQNTIYDDIANRRIQILGFGELDEYFEDGLMVNGSEITVEPKLITFEVGSSTVISSRKACKVKDDNSIWFGANRMSDTVNSTVLFDPVLLPIRPFNYVIPVGIQNLLPHYSIGYYTRELLQPVSDENIALIAEDLSSKNSSSEFSYSDALENIRTGQRVYTGPFNNLVTGREVLTDSKTYNFAPLGEFSLEKKNYVCGEDDLFNQCISWAAVKTSNPDLYESNNPAYKLRLLRLSQGLGVVTSLEIDYENRDIKASGYVIPFFQRGIDYSGK